MNRQNIGRSIHWKFITALPISPQLWIFSMLGWLHSRLWFVLTSLYWAKDERFLIYRSICLCCKCNFCLLRGRVVNELDLYCCVLVSKAPSRTNSISLSIFQIDGTILLECTAVWLRRLAYEWLYKRQIKRTMTLSKAKKWGDCLPYNIQHVFINRPKNKNKIINYTGCDLSDDKNYRTLSDTCAGIVNTILNIQRYNHRHPSPTSSVQSSQTSCNKITASIAESHF